ICADKLANASKCTTRTAPGQSMARDLRPLGDPGSESFQVDRYPFYQLNRLVSRYNTVIEAQLRRIRLEIPTWRVLMILGQQEPRPVGQNAKLRSEEHTSEL